MKTINQKGVQKYVTMRGGGLEKTVKSWQYYSILDFLRMIGMNAFEADELAKWCEKGAKNGDKIETDNYCITVIER